MIRIALLASTALLAACTTATPDPMLVPPVAAETSVPEPAPAPGRKLKRSMGLWMATALVVGNMIGSGVFLLPASLASEAGPVSMLGWVFTGAGAILLRPGKESRWDEVSAIRADFQANEIPIAAELTAPALAEGGDTLWLDEGTLVVGLGYRTNATGAAQIAVALPTVDVLTVDLPHHRGRGEVLHLLSLISPLDDDLVLAYPPLLPVRLVQLLEEVTGGTAEECITRNVIARAGLRDTGFPAGLHVDGPHSLAYEAWFGMIDPPRDYSVYDMSWVGPAASLVTAVADLNRFPQFTARVEDFDLHFLHVVGEAGGRRPLIVTHGWPGSHYEFWQAIEPLAFPSRFGGRAEDAIERGAKVYGQRCGKRDGQDHGTRRHRAPHDGARAPGDRVCQDPLHVRLPPRLIR